MNKAHIGSNVSPMRKPAPAKPERHYILIDYENVQPKNLSMLLADCEWDLRVRVFMGAQQNKVPIELAQPMQRLGDKARYVSISGGGRKALDFHIAHDMGALATQFPDAHFTVITRDSGFDPLIQFMNRQGVSVARRADIAQMPMLSSVDNQSQDEQAEALMKRLRAQGASKPRRRRTLANTVRYLFNGRLDDAGVNRLIDALVRGGHVTVREDGRVTYHTA